MAEYHDARARTRKKIQDAYWSFYERGEENKCTVGDVCSSAGIYRTTFYYHYKSLDEVLESIKNEQMTKIKDLFAKTDRKNIDYTEFIPGFQRLFDENERYLVPLVLEYRDYSYAMEYRFFLKERMLEDLKISYNGNDPAVESVIDVMTSGLNDMFLRSLHSHSVTLEQANAISYGIVTVGLRTVLEEYFGVKVGFRRMV